MCNLKDYDILKDVKDEVLRPSLWTFQQIWSLKKGDDAYLRFLETFFKEISAIPHEYKPKANVLISYLRRYAPTLTLSKLRDIERQVLPEGERFMGKLMGVIEEARIEGRQKGRQEGRQEGLQEGKLEGLQEGLLKGQQEIISKFLKANMDIQTICNVTGLSKQEILNLQKT